MSTIRSLEEPVKKMFFYGCAIGKPRRIAQLAGAGWARHDRRST